MAKTSAIIDIPKKEPARWAAIKMHLEIMGYTLSKLARENGLSPDTIKIVKNKSYPKSQKIIADKLVLKPEWIWPERYGSDGRPIKHSPRYPRKGITRRKRRQCLR
jgi:Ner family transcriptional regulator